MCLGGDNSADVAAGIEKRRQKAITRGESSVNAAFLPFNEEYYKGRERDYRNYYLPQLDLQQKGARGDLIYGLGRSGLIDSSVGAKDFANLQGTYDTARKGIYEGAHDYAQTSRQGIEGQRRQLLQDVDTGGGIGSVGGNAGIAAQIGQPNALSPLGNVFSNLTNNFALSQYSQSLGGPGNPLFSSLANLFQNQGGKSPQTSYTVGGP